ncbi:MAG TPA: TIGR01777 family oxidoreductase [Pedobacter sp.]|jgi:hypothetical protein
MSKTVLITGASGLIGKPLTELLIEKGFKVHQLSRYLDKANKGSKIFKWDVSKMQIDENCLENVDTIINLAGEGIADKAWTNIRKEEIINSRTGALQLLYNVLINNPNHQVKTFISASAVGYYGDRGDEILTEESEPGKDFLANTCLAWEEAADKIGNLDIKLIKFRKGVVLTANGGALPKMAKPVQLGAGAALGTGKQWVPWIHLEDAINMYLYALENEHLEGIFNMTAPVPVTNAEFTQALAKQFNKPLWLPKVPVLALKIMLGEMSRVVLNSNRTSANKIIRESFIFNFSHLENALSNIYDRKAIN